MEEVLSSIALIHLWSQTGDCWDALIKKRGSPGKGIAVVNKLGKVWFHFHMCFSYNTQENTHCP